MTMNRRELLLSAAALGLSVPVLSKIAFADTMADAHALVDKYAMKADKWDGPTTGPKAQAGKTIVVLAGDMKNGGILGATKGVEEAAAAIGWTVKTIDGGGSVAGRTAAMGQAMALNPNGIIINGFDAIEQAPAMKGAMDAKIPFVSWHAGPGVGPLEKTHQPAIAGMPRVARKKIVSQHRGDRNRRHQTGEDRNDIGDA